MPREQDFLFFVLVFVRVESYLNSSRIESRFNGGNETANYTLQNERRSAVGAQKESRQHCII